MVEIPDALAQQALGGAEMLEEGPEHAAAQLGLRARYPQLAAMNIEGRPVIAIRMERVASWGDLRVAEAGPDRDRSPSIR